MPNVTVSLRFGCELLAFASPGWPVVAVCVSPSNASKLGCTESHDVFSVISGRIECFCRLNFERTRHDVGSGLL